MQNYTASTQYNDYIGTSAADSSDTESFEDYLKSKSLIDADEFLVGYEITFNGNHGNSMPEPGIVAWVTKAENFDATVSKSNASGHILRPIDVRNLSIADFFKYFKRFNVKLSRKGIGLNGSDFTTY